jgi:glycosyltransferase involved in cell wall biosynthesis
LKVRLDAGVRAAGISTYAEGLAAALGDVEVVRPPGGLISRLVWRERHRDFTADVLVMTNPELPLRKLPVPTVVVVHDLFPFTSPSLTSPAQRLRFKLLLPRVCERATRIVCVSESTRAALLEHVDVEPDKVVVIGQGPSPFPVLPRKPEGYLLYVGELFRRKNVGVLAGQRLLIAGPGEPKDIPAGAEHLGFVSPQRLAELYAGAAALVLPSLDEGFGRTMLDAFARDVPVIASDIPALREVSGGAAHLVSKPRSPAAWREAVEALPGEAEAMVERGRERAQAYAWPVIADQWRTLLRSLPASTRRSSGT